MATAFYAQQPALLNSSTLTSSPSASSLSPSSSTRSLRSPPRRTSSHPALSTTSLAPPPFHPHPHAHAPPSAFPTLPPHVLTTPDPADAVRPARKSVQLSTAGPVNWSRPIPSASPTKTKPFSSLPQAPAPPRPRRAMSHIPPRRGSNSSPSTSSDDDLPTTPRQLPPGAAPAEPNWSKGVVGLGLGIPEFDAVQVNRTTTMSSCSSTEGSLGGESVTTASSCSPTTPTRLWFVSETLNSLSNPTTLDELRTLRAKAAELDAESKRLRRLRGREAAQCPRLVPRKAVPAVTERDLEKPAAPAPKPRRPAVRHSLIVAPPDPNFALLAEPSRPQARLPPSAFPLQANAARRPFYAQGKAAMSVIEFGTKKEKDKEQAPAAAAAAPAPAPQPARIQSSTPSPSRRLTSGTSFSLRREKSRPPALLTLFPATATSTAPPARALAPSPAPTSPTSPKSPKSLSPKTSFLGKHKKLSRFLGKPQAA